MAKNVIITKTARKKLVQARAGIISLPKIVGMAFGSGGVNSKGEVVPPTDNQTTLTAEMYRKNRRLQRSVRHLHPLRMHPDRKRAGR